MALKLIQQVKYCSNCNKSTVCNQNTKEISWLMHLVLTIFTAGFWLIAFFVMAFFHVLSKPISTGSWICSECGIDISLNPKAKQGFYSSANNKHQNTVSNNIEPKHILLAFLGLGFFIASPSVAITLLSLGGIAYLVVFIMRTIKN